MKKIILLFVFALAIGTNLPVHGQTVSKTEATVIAGNWIKIIIGETGSWGDFENAQIGPIQEFKRNDRKLGYFCHVKPVGFILVSQRKELAPVKAYSVYNNLDPYLDEGMADLLKVCLERIIDTIEQKLGQPIDMVKSSVLQNMVEINYIPDWDNLLGNDPLIIIKNKEKTEGKDNYQEGDILLSSDWHQGPPYNDDCPWLNCGNSNGRALVGCVATAGAQIMHYWNWPPYGSGTGYSDTYDWPNMPDAATTSSPQAEINALAELNSEVGIGVGMSYGCASSGAYTYNMVGVYENLYRYSTECITRSRPSYTAETWFAMMKVQFNQNRPVQYRIPGHSIVGDGWQIIGDNLKLYHMNYGWGGTGDDVWYILDALQGGNPSEEYMVEGIVPVQAMDNWITGTYNVPALPYRYFDKDVLGSNANFGSGHFLQFLPEVVLSGISPTLPVRFNGSTYYNTRLFTAGDDSRGIRIYNGAIEMTNFGSIKFYEE